MDVPRFYVSGGSLTNGDNVDTLHLLSRMREGLLGPLVSTVTLLAPPSSQYVQSTANADDWDSILLSAVNAEEITLHNPPPRVLLNAPASILSMNVQRLSLHSRDRAGLHRVIYTFSRTINSLLLNIHGMAPNEPTFHPALDPTAFLTKLTTLRVAVNSKTIGLLMESCRFPHLSRLRLHVDNAPQDLTLEMVMDLLSSLPSSLNELEVTGKYAADETSMLPLPSWVNAIPCITKVTAPFNLIKKGIDLTASGPSHVSCVNVLLDVEAGKWGLVKNTLTAGKLKIGEWKLGDNCVVQLVTGFGWTKCDDWSVPSEHRDYETQRVFPADDSRSTYLLAV